MEVEVLMPMRIFLSVVLHCLALRMIMNMEIPLVRLLLARFGLAVGRLASSLMQYERADPFIVHLHIASILVILNVLSMPKPRAPLLNDHESLIENDHQGEPSHERRPEVPRGTLLSVL